MNSALEDDPSTSAEVPDPGVPDPGVPDPDVPGPGVHGPGGRPPGPWFALAVATALSVVAYRVVTEQSLLGRDLQETGDTAGDALQVLSGLRAHWLLTGHHTDQFVPHPGPFGLWLKALGEVLHSVGLGMTAMGATGVVLMAAGVAILASAGCAAAVALRSPAGGAAFLAVTAALSAYPWAYPGLPPLTFMLSNFASFPLVLLIAGAFATLRSRCLGLPFLAAGSGMVLHLHSPSAPLGALGSAAVLVLLYASRSQRDRRWWASAGIMAAFLLPLAVRVVADWPWPWTVVIGMRAFNDLVLSRSQVSFERSDLLPQQLQVLLALLTVVCLLLLVRRRTRLTGLVASVLCGYALACWLLLASTHTSNRTFLMWIPVAMCALAGMAVAWLLAALLARGPRVLGALALLVAVPACTWGFGLRAKSDVSWLAGTGSYGAAGAAAVIAAASGRPIAVDYSGGSAHPWPAILLQLERQGAAVCLVDGPRQWHSGVGFWVTPMPGLGTAPACSPDLRGYAVFSDRPLGGQEPAMSKVVYRAILGNELQFGGGMVSPTGQERSQGYEVGLLSTADDPVDNRLASSAPPRP